MESVIQVLEYLKKNGHTVSRASFYRHINEGKISGPPFTENELLEYAGKYIGEKKDARRIRTGEAAELRQAQVDKAKATAGYAKLRTEMLRGDLVSGKEIDMILAQSVHRLLTAIKNFSSSAGHDICDFLDGDPTKIQDFCWIWPEYVEKWMSDFFSHWRQHKQIKTPSISMKEILEYYENIQAGHGGRDIKD